MAPTPEQDVAIGFVTALIYGLYLATFFHCLRWHLFTNAGWALREWRSIPWPIFTATCTLFALCTINRALELKNSMMQAVDSSRMLSTADKKLHVIEMLLCTDANLASQLTDGVLMYRLWRMYNESTAIVVLPIFLWIGGFALTGLQAYVQIVQMEDLKFKLWLPVNMSIGPGIVLIPFWASGIVLNVYATSMIVRRLCLLSRNSLSSESMRSIKFVTLLIIESGALYMVAGIAHFVVWWTPNDFAIAIISNINTPVIGIAFNLIIIRLAQHRAEEDKRTSYGPVSELQFKHTEVKSQGMQAQNQDSDVIQFNSHSQSDASSQSSFMNEILRRRNSIV